MNYVQSRHYKLGNVLTTHLEARVSVHFQSILEKFTPYDTVISVTSASELTETTLSSAFSLHTSASIKSSSSSLRRRRLAEITEDTRESSVLVPHVSDTGKDYHTPTSDEKDMAQPVLVKKEGEEKCDEASHPSQQAILSSTMSRNLEKSLPAIPQEFLQEIDAASQHHLPFEYEIRPSINRRNSSQSARPTTEDFYSANGYKSKVKLGPRPSLEYGSRSGSHPRQNEPRPISSLPAGMRMPQRKPTSPKAQTQRTVPKTKYAESVNLPYTQVFRPSTRYATHDKPIQRPESIRSVSQFSHTSRKSHTDITPEKQRLMKALQLRQKQLAKQSHDECHPVEPVQALSKHHVIVKIEDHESALRKLHDTSTEEADPDVVHVGAHEIEDNTLFHLEASPISLPEPSDGTSTQASSIADGEDDTGRQHNAREPDVIGKAEDIGNERPKTLKDNKVDPFPSPIVSKEDGLPPLYETLEIMSIPDVSQLKPPLEVPLPAGGDDEEVSLSAIRDATQSEQLDSMAPVTNELLQPNSTMPLTSQIMDELEAEDKTRPSTGDTIDFHDMKRKERRRGLVDPIRIISTGENSDDNFLSDDSFIEELKSATLQEAKPISVSRSPITPVFPRSSKTPDLSRSGEPSSVLATTVVNENIETPEPAWLSNLPSLEPESEAAHSLGIEHRPRVERAPDSGRSHEVEPISESGSRASIITRIDCTVFDPFKANSPQDQLQTSPGIPKNRTTRSISISPSPEVTSHRESVPLAKKMGLSSGISQRIKALEKLSSRDNSPGSQSSLSPNGSPAFVSLRKSSLNTPPTSMGFSDVSGRRMRRDFSQPSPTPTTPNEMPMPFPALSCEPLKSVIDLNPDISKIKRESVSVTATIVRDESNQKSEVPKDFAEITTVNLHRSPLVVDHQSTSPTVIESLTPAASKSSITLSNPSSSSDSRKNSIAATRRDSLASKRSNSSRKGSESDLSNLASVAPSTSLASNDSGKEDKKESRKSRLLKRMSNISSISRRSLIHALNPPVREEDSIVERQEPMISETSPSIIDVGDVNVQFPDTLVGTLV